VKVGAWASRWYAATAIFGEQIGRVMRSKLPGAKVERAVADVERVRVRVKGGRGESDPGLGAAKFEHRGDAGGGLGAGGGQGRDRSADLPLFRRTLFQLSYLSSLGARRVYPTDREPSKSFERSSRRAR
jgi:hypothetical protein